MLTDFPLSMTAFPACFFASIKSLFWISHGLVLNCYSHVHAVQSWSTHCLSCWTRFSLFTEYLVCSFMNWPEVAPKLPSSMFQYINNLLVWSFFLGDLSFGIPQPATPGWIGLSQDLLQSLHSVDPFPPPPRISLRTSAVAGCLLNPYVYPDARHFAGLKAINIT